MDREENLQDFSIRYSRRVETYLDCLSMSSSTAADLLVRWINGAAAGVAGNNFLNTSNLLESRLETPETTTGEGGRFR